MTKLFLILVIIVIGGCDRATVRLWIASEETQAITVEGNAEHGEDIFKHGTNGAPPCITCHALTIGGFSVGPVMQDIEERGGKRVDVLSTDDYLRQSILEPRAFVVPGYRPIMYPNYATHLSAQDVADLIAYLKII